MLGRLAMAAACLGLACGGEPGEADAVYVRLHNTSEINFDRLSFRTQQDAFGPLPAGAFSGFLPVEDIYTIEAGYAEAGERRFFGVVFDHLGDSLVGVGYHTYDVVADVDNPEYYLSGFDGMVFFFQTY
jgi:hypothetical protein